MANKPLDIEVTQEMIDAGCDALLDSDFNRDPTVRVENVVFAILLRALQAAGFSPRKSQDEAKI
jgi:hypothetical protein